MGSAYPEFGPKGLKISIRPAESACFIYLLHNVRRWSHNRFIETNSRQLPDIHPIQKFSFLLLSPLSRTGWKLGMIISELISKAAGNAFGGQTERITSNSCPGVFSPGIFDKCLPSSAWTDTDVYGRRQLRVIAVHWAPHSVLGPSRHIAPPHERGR